MLVPRANWEYTIISSCAKYGATQHGTSKSDGTTLGWVAQIGQAIMWVVAPGYGSQNAIGVCHTGFQGGCKAGVVVEVD